MFINYANVKNSKYIAAHQLLFFFVENHFKNIQNVGKLLKYPLVAFKGIAEKSYPQ